MKDRTKYGIGAEGQALDWDLIPWRPIENAIRKLRRRIFRATREQKWNVVRSLMKLMLRSYFNLLVAVRRVTQINKGKKTAGVDKHVALTPKARWALVRNMGKHALWKVKPRYCGGGQKTTVTPSARRRSLTCPTKSGRCFGNGVYDAIPKRENHGLQRNTSAYSIEITGDFTQKLAMQPCISTMWRSFQ